MIVIVVANVFSFPSKKKKRNNHLHDWKDLDLKPLFEKCNDHTK